MTLDFTHAAIADLQSIRDYTLSMWGEQQEASYLDAMWSRFSEMLKSPNRWKKREDLFPGCRIASQARHVILFRIEDDVLQIVRILHSSMDVKRHIPPLD
jgi:toxin ParE1/3/4